MPAGGYQKPPARTGPGGPGKFSKRSDGMDPKKVPDLDNPDMQYGDVQRLTDAQRLVPINPAQAPAPAQARPQGAGVSPGSLPPFLTTMDPTGQEPTTTGLAVGPGAGPEALQDRPMTADLREQVLEYLFVNYGNKDAYELLYRLREESASKMAAAGGGGGGSWGAPSPTMQGWRGGMDALAEGIESGQIQTDEPTTPAPPTVNERPRAVPEGKKR